MVVAADQQDKGSVVACRGLFPDMNLHRFRSTEVALQRMQTFTVQNDPLGPARDLARSSTTPEKSTK